ncbi:hypothetical protein NTGBS_180044 [Candidatus Nitrotoga sp. BS]|nr:hypothetical protein NTGBS_180044 [Candidatus Nitrotoga sp. BS]
MVSVVDIRIAYLPSGPTVSSILSLDLRYWSYATNIRGAINSFNGKNELVWQLISVQIV